MYPVMLNVRGQRCLVVGGGGVALRKVEGLLAEGACVTVVAREPMDALRAMATGGRIELEHRAYQPGEATGYPLVFAATDDREVNRRVFDDARGAGIWVNVADDPELCSFHLPARVRRGAFQLAIASAGEAPFVVRRTRQLLERRFGPEWGEWIEAAARYRTAVRELDVSRSEAEERYDAFFAATIDAQQLKARVPTADEEERLLAGARSTSYVPGTFPERQAPSEEVHGRLPKHIGWVSLVGAGPGDPLLLTLRARQRLLAADAVVVDRLALTALPTDIPARVRIHGVGKHAGNHPVPQGEITELLVRLAHEGKNVVRLKGGDPYVFGRGGEEAIKLSQGGVPFEIVPGVTAGIAVPAYAGIPVTFRREAVRVTLVTAHEAIKSDGPQVRWDLMAQDPHATLVGYMGVSALGAVVEQLLAAGLDPETPAAMIQQGTTSAQRVVRAPVSGLAAAIEQAGLGPPGLFVIGKTVDHADQLDWYGTRPLLGRRVLTIAPYGTLADTLERSGAEVVSVPIPLTPAADLVMGALPLTDCLVRSAHEVEVLDEERGSAGWSSEVSAWCLSPAAARKARELGWQRVQLLEEPITAEQLVAAMRAQ